MPSITVQSIVDRAAAAADMSGDFVTPAQWLAWYNSEARALEFFIARAGWVLNAASTVDATGSPLTATLLAANYPLAVLGAYEVCDGRYRPLRFKSQIDFVRQDYSAAADTGDAHSFTLLSSSSSDDLIVQFYPQPSSGTYRVLYLAGRAPVTALTDSVNWPLGWEERIVLGLARRALIKEESDVRKIEQMMVEQDVIIEEFCWNRNAAESPRVRNVDRVDRGWTDQMQYGPYESWCWL